MKWKIPVATAAAFAMVVVAAPAAQAASGDVTEISNETVGSLVVAEGETLILGNVIVEGDITVEEDAWLDATDATIEGDVIATDAYGVLIDGTSVGGDIVNFGSTRNGFLYLYDLQVDGSVEAGGGIDVEINDSRIAGNLTTGEANYVNVLRTTVGGDVELADNAYGVDVAGAIITGSLTVTGSSQDVLIGANADGSASALGNTVGGNVNLSGNTGNLQLAGTHAAGSIVLAENAPAANFGAGNTAAAVTGDFTGTAAGAATEGDETVAVIVPDARPGELTWSLEGSSSLVDLGIAVEQGDHFQANGELVPVRVTDTRLNGPQWNVSAQISDFAAGDATFAGKHLGWTPKIVEPGAGAVAGAAVQSGFISGEGLAIARTLGSAAAAHEGGSAVIGADLDLKLPLTVGTGQYRATLTLTALG